MTGEQTLYYWINEYDYTLEQSFDGGYCLHDNQEVNEDRFMTLPEVIDYFLESLKEKNDICKADGFEGFDDDIKALERYKNDCM